MAPMIRPSRGRFGLLAVLVGIAAIAALSLSSGGSAATRAVPSNTVLPAITGTPHVGQTLTASQGTWTENPTSFTDQWVRCPASGGQANGSDCAVIGGAPSTSYAVT